MPGAEASTQGRPAVPVLVVLACFAALSIGAATSAPLFIVAPAAAAASVLAVAHQTLLSWRSLLMGLLLVILFIPIRRYAFPGNLPFQLEPYRAYVLLLGGIWIGALLIDRRVQVRKSGLEAPILLVTLGVVGSVIANDHRIHNLDLGTQVVKKIVFLLSFLVVFYVIVSVVRSMRDVDRLVATLVVGGAILAVFGVIESRTGFNPFTKLWQLVPFLQPIDDFTVDLRGSRVRAYGSAQHPIAFAAVLAMFLPLAIYVAQKEKKVRWWVACAAIVLGTLATYTRTSVVMLTTIGVVFLWLRPASVKRLWPAILPALLAVHIAVPGAIGTIKESFFPQGGLIAQQASAAPGSARVSSLGPALDEASQRPILGQGYGTRIVDGPNANAIIVDDQWLLTLPRDRGCGSHRLVVALSAIRETDEPDGTRRSQPPRLVVRRTECVRHCVRCWNACL